MPTHQRLQGDLRIQKNLEEAENNPPPTWEVKHSKIKLELGDDDRWIVKHYINYRKRWSVGILATDIELSLWKDLQTAKAEINALKQQLAGK